MGPMGSLLDPNLSSKITDETPLKISKMNKSTFSSAALVALLFGATLSPLAQQTMRATSAQPATTSADNGPSLQVTLDFLTSVIQSDGGVNINRIVHGTSGSWTEHWETKYSVHSETFPILVLAVQTRNGGEMNGQWQYNPGSWTDSVDLGKVDPDRIRVTKLDSADQGEGFTATPHFVTFDLSLEGTNEQPFVNLQTDKPLSKLTISFLSEDSANRVASAMKRAVVLAGGKVSAF